MLDKLYQFCTDQYYLMPQGGWREWFWDCLALQVDVFRMIARGPRCIQKGGRYGDDDE